MLTFFFRVLGAKKTIIIGLSFEMLQLLWYGFGNQSWMMWAAGILAALASITYPAISAFVSIHSTADRKVRRDNGKWSLAFTIIPFFFSFQALFRGW